MGGMPIGRMALFCLVRCIRSHPKQRAYHLSCRFRCKPQMINGWNLKLIPLKRKIIWTKPPFFLFHANFPGSKALKKTTTCRADHGALPIPHLSPQKKSWNPETHLHISIITKLSISNKGEASVKNSIPSLGSGFKYFIFTPTWGRFPFWLIFFQRGWWTNHQPESLFLGVFWWIPCVSFLEEILSEIGKVPWKIPLKSVPKNPLKWCQNEDKWGLILQNRV